MQNASFPTVLSDSQRRMILPHLTKPAKRGRPRTDPQRIIDAVPYPVESGVQRCLPPLGNREFSEWHYKGNNPYRTAVDKMSVTAYVYWNAPRVIRIEWISHDMVNPTK